MMSYFVYVIESEINSRRYTGQTSNLKRRLAEHNSGKSKATKPNMPYKLIHYEEFNSRNEAVEREKYLKSGIGRDLLKQILSQ